MFRDSLGLLLTWTCLITTVVTNPVRSSPCLDLVQLQAHLDLSEDVQFNASVIAAGALNISGTKSTNDFPLCRVMGSMMYGLKNNNTLLFEVWLPEASAYNGRYLSVGNGGFAGVIDYESMFTNLNTGFAVGGCDSGHKTSQNGPTRPGGYVDFMHNVDETRAWIQNSIAMFTAPAKELTTAYYKTTPKKMYYAGCSTGGAQGFALAQYHPEVFDGIYAGSPGNWYSHLILSFLWNGLASNSSEAFLSQSALNFTRDAVVANCDAIDGVYDGLIEDPNACDFDISSLECAAGQAPTKADNTTVCLTEAQIANVRSFYSGPKRADTGTSIYPGFAHGSESEWLLLENSLWIQYGIPILQNLVFKNLSYDYRSFNWASDVDLVDQIASPLIDEISPNLTAFEKRGGKLVVTQGWADPFNAPFWPINQREEMAQIFGNGLDDWYRLFMVPGGGHCGGATSYPQMPGTWHGLDALIPWVEEDTAPAAVLASKPADGSSATRKLCPYPAKAVYVGEDQNDWDSYVCS